MENPQPKDSPTSRQPDQSASTPEMQSSLSRNVPERSGPQTAERFLAATENAQAKASSEAILMADGTHRTKDGVIIKPSDWRHQDNALGRTYRKLHRGYLRLTLRWPRWVPRAALAGVILLVVVNVAVIGAYVNNRKTAQQQGPALPTAGVVPADGSKYYAADAKWQFAGASAAWSVEEMKAVDGRRYSSPDGTCQVQVVRSDVDRAGSAIDTVSQTTVQKYAITPSSAKAQVGLPSITVRAVAGEQRYEFARRRYNYKTAADPAQVSEVSVRTLGKHVLAIVQTCQQDAWDQTQAARDALVGNLSIAAR